MPKTASSSSARSSAPAHSTFSDAAAPAVPPPPAPFLLTGRQGEAARALLRYVTSLALPGPDAQLLAAVVAIRAARGGIGNLTGKDLSSLRLGDARGAVDALRGLGWRVDDALLDGDPSVPVPFTVPDLEQGDGHPLPLGKNVRSRVSGWATRTLAAKPVRKLPAVARLAGLFLAAHSTSQLQGRFPAGLSLPDACRDALPGLLEKGFLAEWSGEGNGGGSGDGERWLLGPAVRHLSGRRPPTAEELPDEVVPQQSVEAASPKAPKFRFDAEEWAGWKGTLTPALRKHVEAVEFCAVCALPAERVAEAFLTSCPRQPVAEKVEAQYGKWQEEHPDRGPLAARFSVEFRAEHGHGPSYSQLCTGLGWKKLRRSLRGLVVERMLTDGWLTDTSPVPWTLRPGKAAQTRGITLPAARSAAAAETEAARAVPGV
ncbi:hypothetical protein [Streptomyces sp. NPDC051561]|uniref:hypothetical protein n=1 Tax=Streptomyces sp. NPDC051561 TaxID=3365658 RepID=UPI0037A94D48